MSFNFTKTQDGGTLCYLVEGRLDAITSPSLNDDIKTSLDNITELVFDFSNLDYISSAGLRVLLTALKIMSEKGSMVVKNINEDIKDIFEVTGFLDVLDIQ